MDLPAVLAARGRSPEIPESFHWLREALEPDGKTWRLAGEFRAVRMRQQK